uniref:Major facilitator superfamily (MFS) profile domain-containing protein n=1 Tax=Oryza meridionalis TaxID=40149 RepID=A0A0E0EDJ9_9ORYZ
MGSVVGARVGHAFRSPSLLPFPSVPPLSLSSSSVFALRLLLPHGSLPAHSSPLLLLLPSTRHHRASPSFFLRLALPRKAERKGGIRSMVNCMTSNPTSRVALVSCRNAFTMIANLSLYGIALLIFSLRQSVSVIVQYRWIAYVSIALGSCFVVVFLIGTKEPGLNQHCQNKRLSRISWTHWFKKVLYYQVALVYMFTRLVTNVSQALLAFYVINDLEMPQSSKALVPAIIYVCSLIVSVILQETRWSSWRLKNYFSAGAMLWILSGVGIVVLPSGMHNFMYALSITIGVANALMTVTSISMEGILVGEDLNGCAFVYGSLSFVDKVSCGLALYILESYQGSTNTRQNLESTFGYSVTRLGLGLVPAACSLLSAIIAYTMDLPDTRRRPLVEPLLA